MTSVDMPPQGRDPVDAAARDDLQGLFELETVHRRGPASLVCVGRDLEFNQPVALKLMPRASGAGAEAEEGFHRAAALVAALDHPHVVPLYGAGATDRFFWYSMEYIEGRSLSEALRSSGPMEPAACLRLVRQVATALDTAHGLGVVHAGLTPANVLIDAAGDAHVTDFWIPWVLERLGALPGDGGKTRRDKYRAPEQIAEGRCGPETDQFALAALMQACLVKTPARIPPDMARAIERALNPTPEARFPSVQDFVAALGPSGARSTSVVLLGRDQKGEDDEDDDDNDAGYQGYAPPRFRWRWPAAAVLALVALGAVATPWLLSSGRDVTTGGSEYTPAPADSFVATRSEGVRPDAVPLVSPAPVVKPPVRAEPARRPSAPPRRPPPAPRPRPRDVASLAAPGHLFVNATPWGQLFVDGELIGNTPRADVQVAPGAHRLRVTRDGFQPFELAIRIAAGQELRITDIVLQEIKP